MSPGTLSARAPGVPRALDTVWFLVDPVGFFERSAKRHGATFRASTWMYGDALVVSDPDTVRDVFGRDPEIFRGGEANSFLRPVVGARSVSCIDGAEHTARRRMILPALHERLQDATGAVRAITEREIVRLPEGRPVALQPAMRRIMLAAMLGAVLGNAGEVDRAALGDALTRLVDRGTWPLSQLGAIPWLQRDLGPWAWFQRDLARVDERLYAEIARRKRGAASEGDVLDHLLAARDDTGRALEPAELRDDLITIAGAGYDTTATALAWTFERILEHPDVHAKVLGELGAARTIGETPYLDATIKEALRQRPVLPTVSRVVRDDVEVAGHRVAKGTRVAVCVYLAHHDAASYPDPERFLPERFLDARPSPWVPFGGGGRRCPGMAFALDTMRTVVATTLSRVALRRPSRGPSRPVFRGSTLAPADGTRVVIARRAE